MRKGRGCSFYEVSENPEIGFGLGYCDLGSFWTICNADMRYCEKPEAIIKYLYMEWGKRKGSEGFIGLQVWKSVKN